MENLRKCEFREGYDKFQKGFFHRWGNLRGDNEGDTITYGIVEDETGQIHTTEPYNIKFDNNTVVD